MKKFLFLFVLLCIGALSVDAQNDTIYFMKDGVVVNKQSLRNTDVDSLIVYRPATATSCSFKDSRDGNVYKCVKIGCLVWMAENLRYLPSVVGSSTASYTTPYYYVYGYEGTNVVAAKANSNYATYGVLYNWAAAKAAVPDGWHLATDAEWTLLTDYLGGTSVAGGKLKEAGLVHWYSPNESATNEFSFTAIPGGRLDGAPQGILSYGGWWTATELNINSAWYRSTYSYIGDIVRGDSYKAVGYSVRCVRNY